MTPCKSLLTAYRLCDDHRGKMSGRKQYTLPAGWSDDLEALL